MDLEQRLIRVESIEAIRTLKARYCDLCDEGYDADALCALFTEDAVWDGGKLGVYEGIEKIHEFFVDMPNIMSFAIHNVTNSAVELGQDGQSAVARWYLIQMATQKEQNLAVWLTGRYVDQLVLENDIWKFKHVSLTTRFYSPYDQGWAERNFVAAKS